MEITLTPLFLHVEAVGQILGSVTTSFADAQRTPRGKTQLHIELAAELARSARELAIPELQSFNLKDVVAAGQIVSIEQAFYFKRLATESGPRIRFRGKLDTDPSIVVEGLIDPDRLTSQSAHDHLSRRAHVDIIAQVIDVGPTVRLRALFIGWRAFGLTRGERHSGLYSVDRQVFPMQIDNFADVDWASPLSKAQFNAVADVPEATVKAAIATLLHEFDVAKDWGGEQSDLYTLNVRVGGVPLSSSWLLKGRSVKRPMRIADLGKNGDQLDRLSRENTDLLVLQSNQGQTANVRNMVAAYAHDMRNPRRYMLLDGMATGMLLRHTGDLP